jgi:hypothetical protein
LSTAWNILIIQKQEACQVILSYHNLLIKSEVSFCIAKEDITYLFRLQNVLEEFQLPQLSKHQDKILGLTNLMWYRSFP